MINLLAPTNPGYLRLVRVSARYDLVVTAGFATPWTYMLLHDALSHLSATLGLGVLPALDPLQTLYANLMGSVVISWALLRIVRTQPVHGLLDGGTRVLFSSWQAYALAHGATRLLWLFLAFEAMFGVAQLLPWWNTRRVRNDPTDTALGDQGPEGSR